MITLFFDSNSQNNLFPHMSNLKIDEKWIKKRKYLTFIRSFKSLSFYRTILNSVTIPSILISIDEKAFYGCSWLHKVIFTASILKNSDYLFKGSVLKIGGNAFRDCRHLNKIDLPLVQEIRKSAFANCTRLTKINLPEILTQIGPKSFENCVNLQSIKIPNSVIEIGESIFSNCLAMEKAILSDNIISIPKLTFNGCLNLKEVTISQNTKEILSGAFKDCISITKFDFPPNVETIDERAFYGCKNIKEITIPKSVGELKPNVFEGCLSLEKVSIPDSLVSTEGNAFYKCPTHYQEWLKSSDDLYEFLNGLDAYIDSISEFDENVIDWISKMPLKCSGENFVEDFINRKNLLLYFDNEINYVIPDNYSLVDQLSTQIIIFQEFSPLFIDKQKKCEPYEEEKIQDFTKSVIYIFRYANHFLDKDQLEEIQLDDLKRQLSNVVSFFIPENSDANLIDDLDYIYINYFKEINFYYESSEGIDYLYEEEEEEWYIH